MLERTKINRPYQFLLQQELENRTLDQLDLILVGKKKKTNETNKEKKKKERAAQSYSKQQRHECPGTLVSSS
jgi:hypothetical protein